MGALIVCVVLVAMAGCDNVASLTTSIAVGDTLRCPGGTCLRTQPPQLLWLQRWQHEVDWFEGAVSVKEGSFFKILGIVKGTVVVALLDPARDDEWCTIPYAQPWHRFFFSRRKAKLWRYNVFAHKRESGREIDKASGKARRLQEKQREAQAIIDAVSRFP